MSRTDDPTLHDAYTTAVRSRPRKSRPVRIKLSTARATQLRNALDQATTGEPVPDDAHAVLSVLRDALTAVLPPQLITPTGPSK